MKVSDKRKVLILKVLLVIDSIAVIVFPFFQELRPLVIDIVWEMILFAWIINLLEFKISKTTEDK